VIVVNHACRFECKLDHGELVCDCRKGHRGHEEHFVNAKGVCGLDCVDVACARGEEVNREFRLIEQFVSVVGFS